ncbi:MAG: prepilin-type N-terminal cleavage/methylation domain-containing protein [Dehalococcoidia bacterium]
MKRLVRNLVRRLRGHQLGFTLVELLVVVGIIVALAAVIIPNVIQFAGKGEEGAKAAEMSNVQAAMDSMMADLGVTVVTANDLVTDTSVNDFTLVPVEGPLITYMRDNPTTYAYCWDVAGLILPISDLAPTLICSDN